MGWKLSESASWSLLDYYRLLRVDRSYFDSLVPDDAWTFEAQRPDNSYGPTVMRGWFLGDCLGWSWQIHKFEAIDWQEQFHSHQARWGIRRILSGGYVEEVLQPDESIRHVIWEEGQWGIVPRSMHHRTVRLLGNRPAYTLWIRGPTRNPVKWTYPDGSTRVLSIEEMN